MSFRCPTCGAALPGSPEGAALVICDYCRTTSAVAAGGLTPQGTSAALLDPEGPFALGATGTLAAHLGGAAFEVKGRARYATDAGAWDDWLLALDGGGSRIVEQGEGTLTLYDEWRSAGPIVLAGHWPGSSLELLGRSIVVRAMGRGWLEGGQGGVVCPFAPGVRFDFVEGSSERRLARVAGDGARTTLFLGRALELEDFELAEAA